MKILDTNILMETKRVSSLQERFKDDLPLGVTIGTLMELDRMKSADGQRGFEARNGLRMLREKPKLFHFLIADNPQRSTYDPSTVDGDIIWTALNSTEKINGIVTNDLSMATIASANGAKVEEYHESADKYSNGYQVFEIGNQLYEDEMTDAEMAMALCLEHRISIGEYCVLTSYGRPISFFRLTSCGLEKVLDSSKKRVQISSKEFGAICPKKNDIAQLLAFDMVGKQDISLLTGPAGSGKTLIMLAKQFEMIERGEIQKITIFVNPEKARGAKTLGFYKGDRNLKLMQESIGGILASKLDAQGGPSYVEQLIEDGVIEVLPVSDIRGYEVSPYSSLYITEAQNLNKDLMQLAIQRASEGCKIFIEGDPTTQLDSWMYEGDNNGMLKLIEVFSGSGLFGNINLQKVYRSPVADLAEKMTK